MSNALERIADALEGIEQMMREDRDMMQRHQEEAAQYVDPATCEHPRTHRVPHEDGAFARIGCQLCGADDITKIVRRTA